MPRFLGFNLYRRAVAAYLANRHPIDFTEYLNVVNSHILDVRTAWELGHRFQDCGNLLAVKDLDPCQECAARGSIMPTCPALRPRCSSASPSLRPRQERPTRRSIPKERTWWLPGIWSFRRRAACSTLQIPASYAQHRKDVPVANPDPIRFAAYRRNHHRRRELPL